jgi:co-chaperonin GroES (HSP10)
MPRKDVLAAGQRSAQFVGGMGDGIDLHKVSDEPRMEFVPEPTAAARRKKFIPAGEVLLVKRAEAKLGNGIIELAESVSKEQPAEGTIIDISRKHEHAWQVGQYIAFGKYSGTLFMLNGEELLLLEADEVKGEIVDEGITNGK